MNHIPAVKSVMTPFPYSIDIDASIAEARAFMQQHKIRHMPVTENDILKGVLTDRDIKMFLGLDSSMREEKQTLVKDVYQEQVVTVDLNERLDKVLDIFVEKRIGSVLVIRQGKLAGVFTMTDACRCYANHLREQFGPSGGNTAA